MPSSACEAVGIGRDPFLWTSSDMIGVSFPCTAVAPYAKSQALDDAVVALMEKLKFFQNRKYEQSPAKAQQVSVRGRGGLVGA